MAYTFKKTRNIKADIMKWVVLLLIMIPLIFVGIFSSVVHKGTMQNIDKTIVQYNKMLK